MEKKNMWNRIEMLVGSLCMGIIIGFWAQSVPIGFLATICWLNLGLSIENTYRPK